jgi:NAD(P)H dehydrogenase (quinone)
MVSGMTSGHVPGTGPIAVTGSTGRLGGRVARRLAAAGTPQRLLVRDLSRAPELPGATAVTAPYHDGGAVRAALDGISTVLMVSAAESQDRVDQHRTFVDAAVAAGVTHLVYISFYGAAPDATFTHARDHWHTEWHIRSSGLQFTFLRDNLYADFLPGLVGQDGVIRGPAGDGKVALVAQDDIADVAAIVLGDPEPHAGRTYDLTGPEALTFTEIAAILTKTTGRPVGYHPETIDEARASRASYGAPDWLVEAWISTYTAVAVGELAGVSPAVAELTGRAATTLEDVLRSLR